MAKAANELLAQRQRSLTRRTSATADGGSTDRRKASRIIPSTLQSGIEDRPCHTAWRCRRLVRHRQCRQNSFKYRAPPSAAYRMKQLRCDSIGWVGVCPLKWSGSLIVGFDVAHEFAAQVGHGFKDLNFLRKRGLGFYFVS